MNGEVVGAISAVGSDLRWYLDRFGTDSVAYGGYLVSGERRRLLGSAGRLFGGRDRGGAADQRR